METTRICELGWYPICKVVLTTIRQWGLSAYYAYRAYQDETFYNIAKDSWNRVSSYLVNTDDAQTGTQGTRSVDFETTCLAGASIFDRQ